MQRWEYCCLDWLTDLISDEQREFYRARGFTDKIYLDEEDKRQFSKFDKQTLDQFASFGYLYEMVSGVEQKKQGKPIESLHRAIADLGVQGWEMVAWQFDTAPSQTDKTTQTFYFKRPMAE